LVRSARDFQERPMQMRFGGAAGPIAFERMRRMHNGSWDAVTVPMGLALRTSALLEPYARPGCALIEERFHEFGGSRNMRDGDVDRIAGSADEFSGRFMAPLSAADLPDIDFDREDQKFILRKNLLDPPYHTRLWQINLN
jgi:hypothetical protein